MTENIAIPQRQTWAAFIPGTTSIHWNTKAEIRKDSGGLLLVYLRFAFGKTEINRAGMGFGLGLRGPGSQKDSH